MRMRHLMSLSLLLIPLGATLSGTASAQVGFSVGQFQDQFCPNEPVASVVVHTKTASVSGAGTDGEVRFFMGSRSYSPYGNGSGIGRYLVLDKSGYNDFEQGEVDDYIFNNPGGNLRVGDITQVGMQVIGNGTLGADLSLDEVDVYINGKPFYLRKGRWDISAGTAVSESFGGVLYGLLKPAAAVTQTNQAVGTHVEYQYNPGCSETISLTSMPRNGTLSGGFPNYYYTPNPGFRGTDTFDVTSTGPYSPIEYPRSLTSTATVTIDVQYENSPPVAVSDSASTPEDQPVAIPVLANDYDLDIKTGAYVGEVMNIAAISRPGFGTAANVNNNIVYTPNPNFNGKDSFTYTIADHKGASSTTFVEVNVTPVNDPPLATPQSVTVKLNTAAPITLAGTDVDGDALTYAITGQPASGQLAGTAPSLTYTPKTGYTGSDSITFTVSDGKVTSAPAKVTLNVQGTLPAVNHFPTMDEGNFTVKNTDTLNINAVRDLHAADPDGDTLGFNLLAFPLHGMVKGSYASLIYRPDAGYVGADTYRFRVSDGHGGSKDVSVNLTVTAGSPPPPPVPAFVSILKSGYALNRSNGHYTQVLTLTNTGTSVTGPISLVLTGLTQGVAFSNASGLTTKLTPTGNPYITVNLGSDGALTPGETVTVTLDFTNTDRQPMNYDLRALLGPM